MRIEGPAVRLVIVDPVEVIRYVGRPRERQ